jgi:hypothetical protein
MIRNDIGLNREVPVHFRTPKPEKPKNGRTGRTLGRKAVAQTCSQRTVPPRGRTVCPNLNF